MKPPYHKEKNPAQAEVEGAPNEQKLSYEDIENIFIEISIILTEAANLKQEEGVQEKIEYIAERIRNFLPVLEKILDKSRGIYLEILSLLNFLSIIYVGPYNRDFLNIKNYFIGENLEKIIEIATRQDIANDDEEAEAKEIRIRTMRVLSLATINSKEEYRKKILEQIDAKRAEFITQGDQDIFEDYYFAIYNFGTYEQKQNAAYFVLSFYSSEDEEKRSFGLKIIKKYYSQKKLSTDRVADIEQNSDPIFKYIKSKLEKFLPKDAVEELIAEMNINGPKNKIKFSYEYNNRDIRLVDNLETILYLEKMRPGICRLLRKKFGIRNFFRYPPEILIHQYDNYKNKSKKGIYVVSTSDHNGAFCNMTDSISDLFKKIQTSGEEGQQTYDLMIYEISDIRELTRAISHARKNSEDDKLYFGILLGHGTKSSIELGEKKGGKEREEKLQTKDLEHKIAQKLADVFEKNSPIALISCDTGQELAKEISRLGLKVSAPKEVDSLESYEVIKKGRSLNIKPKFKLRSEETYLNGQEI